MNILLITISNLIFLILGIFLGRLSKSSNNTFLPTENVNIKMPTIESPFPVMIIEKPKGFKSNGEEDIKPKGRRITLTD